MSTINLTGDGGVVKRVLRSPKPDALQPNDAFPIADVHYEGRLVSDGTVFDSSREDNAMFTFEVGAGQVIRAWDIGVKSMKVGELALLICHPDYAYGSAGSPPDIPPNAVLEFEVELLAVRAPKGSSSIQADVGRLDELRREREIAASKREEEKKKREEAKALAAARLQEKLAKGAKGGGKGKKKG